MLLTATAQQSSRKQVSASDKSDATSAKPPAQADETQASTAPTNTARANTAQATPSRTRSDDRRDKKDDKDKADQDDDLDEDAPQAQVPAISIPVAAPVAVPPGMPANPQTFDAILAAATPNSDTGQAVPAADNDSKVDTTAPQTAAQPVDVNAPAVQTPAPLQALGDDGGDAPDAPPPVIAAANPPARNRTDDNKPAADKAVKAAADQPETVLNTQPAPPANDPSAVAQVAMAAPPAMNISGPAAANTASNTIAATQVADTAAPATDKSRAADARPTDKPSRPTAGTPATVPGPASLPATASPVAVAHTEMAKDNGSPKSNSDAKPIHVGDTQPDVPAPAPQAAPPAAMPPHMAVNAFGIAAPAAAAGNSMVTSSVQVTEADADPTPDMDALAVSVAARAMSGAKQFQIRLDPPELGRVDVRLSIDASGKTQAHMTADQPQTLDLLQKDATTLTQALRDAGLDVSQSGLNFSLRGQDRQNDDSNNGGAQGRRTNLIATRAIQAAQSPNAISFNGAAADARVDIHV